MKPLTPILVGAGVLAVVALSATKQGTSSSRRSLEEDTLSKMSWTPQSAARVRREISQRLEKEKIAPDMESVIAARFRIVRDAVSSVFKDFAPRDARWPSSIDEFEIRSDSFIAVPQWVEENPVYGGSMYALWLEAQNVFDEMYGLDAAGPVREVG